MDMHMATAHTSPSPTGRRYGPPVQLDLAFAMDCTGSMGSYIQSAKQSIKDIVKAIIESNTCDDVKLALVEYRDHRPQDRTFVTRVHDFTSSVDEMKEWLQKASADGGGDHPEAVADAMKDVTQLSWRLRSTKICVLICDAPPHGLHHEGDGFASGCPKGHDPVVLSAELAETGVVLYVVGCEPAINPYKDFFIVMADKSGGQYVPLQEAEQLAQVIIGAADVELCMQQVLESINWEVLEQLEARKVGEQNIQAAGDRTVENDKVVAVMHKRLTERGVETFQLQENGKPLIVTSRQANALSRCSTLLEISSKFHLSESAYDPYHKETRRCVFSTERTLISNQQTERLVRMAAFRNRVEW